MYSSERIKNSIKKDIAFLPAGIHDDVEFVSARIGESPNYVKYIEFSFKKGNLTFTPTEYAKVRFENESDEAYQERCDSQFDRIMQILECFYDRNSLEFVGETFDEFAKWVVDLLNNADKTELVRVKVVYNDRNNYTNFPRYRKYTFIEPMSKVRAGKSVITKLSIDKFEKTESADSLNSDIIADIEKQEVNPLVSADVAIDDDLPF